MGVSGDTHDAVVGVCIAVGAIALIAATAWLIIWYGQPQRRCSSEREVAEYRSFVRECAINSHDTVYECEVKAGRVQGCSP